MIFFVWIQAEWISKRVGVAPRGRTFKPHPIRLILLSLVPRDCVQLYPIVKHLPTNSACLPSSPPCCFAKSWAPSAKFFFSFPHSLSSWACVCFFSPVAIPLLLRLEAWAVRDPRWRRRKSCQPQIWTWCACVCVCSCIALAGRQLFPLFTSRCRRRSAASIGARHAALRTCCRLRRTSWWRAWRRRCRNTNDPDICCACTWSAGLRWGCRWWRAVPRRPTGGRRAGTPRLRCPVGSAPFAAAPLRWTSPVASCPPPLGSSTPGWWSPQQLLLPSSFIIFQIQFDTLDSAYCGPTILLVTTSYDHNTWKTLDIFP